MAEANLEVPYIETDRLILRGLTADDIGFLFEHFSKDEINECSSADNVTSLKEAEEFYEKYIVPTPTRFRLGLVFKKTNRLIGTVGVYKYSKRDSCLTVGADLAKEYWGFGLMKETLDALIQHGFEKMALNRIEATTDPENIRAVRLIERLGFSKEGVLRGKYFYKGRFHDDIIYSLLREEWMKI